MEAEVGSERHYRQRNDGTKVPRCRSQQTKTTWRKLLFVYYPTRLAPFRSSFPLETGRRRLMVPSFCSEANGSDLGYSLLRYNCRVQTREPVCWPRTGIFQMQNNDIHIAIASSCAVWLTQ